MSVSEVEIPSWMVVPVLEASDEFAKKNRMQDQDAAVFDAAVKHAYDRFIRLTAEGERPAAWRKLDGLPSDAHNWQVYNDVLRELKKDLKQGAPWLNTVTGASHSWASDRP